jgi:hypothetical protein
MTKQNLSPTFKALDEVLTEIAWCENDKYVTLAQKLAKPSKNSTPNTLDSLPIADLRGAFISLQIRFELFSERVEELRKKDLVTKIKNLIFIQVRENLGRLKKAA